jgi:endoglucanase
MNYKVDQESLNFLFDLLNTSSPSGSEKEATKLYARYIEPYCDTVQFDTIGNVTGVLKENNPLKVLLGAHIDEVGLQITGIKSTGLLTFRTVGGIDILSLYGHEVIILSKHGKINGIIGGDREKMNFDSGNAICLKYTDLWIDIDTHSDEETCKMVDIGNFACFRNNPRLQNNRVYSKSLDDKIGVFIISQILKSVKKEKLSCCLYATATVQEEIGTKGMAVLAQSIRPELGFIVDVGHVDYTNEKYSSKLHIGKGVGLIKNTDNHSGLFEWTELTAKENNIPIQLSIGKNITGGTDSSKLQLFGGNTKVIDISIPCKYIHSHNEIVDIKDVESAINLILHILSNQKINKIHL